MELYDEPDERIQDDYWAREPDPDELADNILDRIDTFMGQVHHSELSERRRRNIAYFYNDYYPEQLDSGGMELKALGMEGEYVGLVANHFRNILKHMLNIATQHRPAWDTRAVNSENRSLHQARLGNAILDYYMSDKRVERYLKNAAEHALVLGAGFTNVEWDPEAGNQVELDPMTGTRYFEGDVEFTNPLLFDVAWDYRLRDWRKLTWYAVRFWENRWELEARFPEYSEDILGYAQEDKFRHERSYNVADDESDIIPYWKFYHMPTEAMPDGRYLMTLQDGTALIDTISPYKHPTLYRLVPSEIMNSCFGWTVAYDLQGPQEALNGELSSIATNHKTFGVQNIWCQKGSIRARQIEGGLNIVESQIKPEPLNLTETPAEIFQFYRDLIQQMEYISGVNSVVRGQPEANMRSGNSMALVDSKAFQVANDYILGVYNHYEDIGTGLLRLLRDFGSTERVISIQGKHNRPYQHHFSGNDLDRIDRVMVTVGNPLTRTTAGRLEIARDLMSQGLIRVPEEYFNVLETGNIDVMIEGERAQLDLVRSENEKLMVLEECPTMETDYHLLHIQEHQALLNSPEARYDEALSQSILSHMMVHIQMLMDPNLYMWQMAMGFRVPGMMPPMPPSIGPPMGGGQNGTPAKPKAEEAEFYGNDAGVGMPSMPEPAQAGAS